MQSHSDVRRQTVPEKPQEPRFLGLIALSLLTAFSMVGTLPAGGQTSSGDRADELSAKAETIRRKIDELVNSPEAPEAWKELQALKQRMSEVRQKHQNELQPLYERQKELSQTDAVQKRQKELHDLYNELRRARNRLQNELIERGRRLHEKRRAELAKIAVTAAPHAREVGFDVLTYPAEDGSTSTQPLSIIIACKFLGMDYEWQQSQRYSRPWGLGRAELFSNAGLPYLMPGRERPPMMFSLASYRPVAVARKGTQREERLAVLINRLLTTHSGTHGAYKNIITGKADVALIARKPSQKELKLATENGVELVATPAARDGFVFMTHYNNPVDNLTADQITDIYTGKITNWKAVGGTERKITPYRRDEQSGSQELMNALVMKDREMGSYGSGMRPMVAHGMGGPFGNRRRGRNRLLGLLLRTFHGRQSSNQTHRRQWRPPELRNDR